MSAATPEESSSSQVRDEIISQHDALRALLAQVVDASERATWSERDLETLRERAKALYEALSAHMAFEERVLPEALRDVIGWGPVIQQKMEEDHARQREILATAIADVGPRVRLDGGGPVDLRELQRLRSACDGGAQ